MKFPIIVKISLFLIGLVAFLFIMYVAQAIILPLLFAAIIAIILHPVVNLFMRLKIHRVIAIVISLFLSLILVVAFGSFLYAQFNSLIESLPLFIERGAQIINDANVWASNYLDLKPELINDWFSKHKEEFININGAEIGKTLVSLGSLMGALFIIPVYVFLFLYYHSLLLEFLRRLFGKANRREVSAIITEVKTLIQRYLIGLSIEVAIIAILYAVALFALDIKYALILAILGALVNIIPYLGATVAALMPMLVAFSTKSSPWFAFLVMAIYFIIQIIDNNFLVPKIVASKVKINVLVSIFVVIAFGSLWGIPGMFLSIPLTAIVKLIFDHVESLKPWGFLLGDTIPLKMKGRK